MNGWVLLLRGINVGGRNKLPMADLRALLKGFGVAQIRTVVNSGNVVFAGVIDARAFGEIVEDEIRARHGFRPQSLVLSRERFLEIVERYPWPEARKDPAKGHIWFFDQPVTAPIGPFRELASPTERVALGDGALYLYAPDGIARSKLAEKAERLLGVPATARNLNTVAKLATLLRGLRDD